MKTLLSTFFSGLYLCQYRMIPKVKIFVFSLIIRWQLALVTYGTRFFKSFLVRGLPIFHFLELCVTHLDLISFCTLLHEYVQMKVIWALTFFNFTQFFYGRNVATHPRVMFMLKYNGIMLSFIHSHYLSSIR